VSPGPPVDGVHPEGDRVGLTLGKFAPFHRGHQHLVETALSEIDHLIVAVYDAPESEIPLPRRAAWIRRLYPEAEVVEAWGGPAEVGYTAEIKRAQEEYLLSLLGQRRITHFFSSEPYGEHVSKALGAIDRRVDPERGTVPVRGRDVRRNPSAWRDYLDPLVYRDLVLNVVALGGPSTGKTTLTEALASHFSTALMPEYGREFWHLHQAQRRLTQEQLVDLAEGHLAREEERLLEADRYLFTDTNAVTTYLYCQLWHSHSPHHLRKLAVACRDRYDLVILCADDFPHAETWDRSGAGERSVLQAMTRAFLREYRIPHLLVQGGPEERLEAAVRCVSGLRKFADLPVVTSAGVGPPTP